MDRKLKTATTTLGVLAGLFALGATIFAARNKTTLKDRSALFLHNRIGFPIYNYIKRKENIPF